MRRARTAKPPRRKPTQMQSILRKIGAGPSIGSAPFHDCLSWIPASVLLVEVATTPSLAEAAAAPSMKVVVTFRNAMLTLSLGTLNAIMASVTKQRRCCWQMSPSRRLDVA